MDNFEDQLKRAMTQKDPPPDFGARVMARIETKNAAKREARWWQIILLPARNAALAGGLACLMIAGAVTAYHQHQVRLEERRRAEEARDQLLVALRITSAQLHRVSRVLSPGGSAR